MSKKTKKIFDSMLMCGVVVAVVFHLNSKLSSKNKENTPSKPKTENVQMQTRPDSLSVDSVLVKNYMRQKTR